MLKSGSQTKIWHILSTPPIQKTARDRKMEKDILQQCSQWSSILILQKKIPAAEATKILKIIAKGKPFTLHHYSLYYGAWRDDKFYVGKSGNLTIGELSEDEKYLSELSFNMTGVNPI